MPRPQGSPNKNGYKLSPAAYHQRVVAPLKTGATRKVMQEIINREELTAEQKEILVEEKLNLWKRMQTPALMLMDEYVELKTLINAKHMTGKIDITDKAYIALANTLLNLSKEVNRLTQLTEKDKVEAFVKSFSESEDIVIDVNEEK